ncbi:protein CUSTOS isoform X2 [Gouania willdenowi]|uniref:Protein CUSTOS n=1 Tax=Gouania willdenowi TaxID=441366 RepID=A0A8C5DB40_GOUWI|nr:protein CUSTOS isoform X2 [Gouania willdenowi]
MAARAVKSVRVSKNSINSSSSSSSNDDEDLQKCKEAVWELHIPKPTGGDSDMKDSKRVVVADHDHDGNDLQVTKGFRTHVAKKLGHYLDSCISETQPEMPFNVECDDDDEGFRLFSTSVPGQKAEDPPAPVRHRPASSSSDSEMERRLKEAAVSIKDLLPSLSLPIADSPCSTDTPSSEKVKKLKKKKENSYDKKKKQDHDKCQDTNLPCSAQNSERSSENEILEQVAVKRKKKKQKRITEENATD